MGERRGFMAVLSNIEKREEQGKYDRKWFAFKKGD